MQKLTAVMEEWFEFMPMEEMSGSPNVENVSFAVMRDRVLATVNSFTGAPFTIQRLCEMVTNPRKHYRRTDKFMRGVEKNVNVVSTVDPFGTKIVSEPKLVNGLENSNGLDNGKTSKPTDPRSVLSLPGPEKQSSPQPSYGSAEADMEADNPMSGTNRSMVSEQEHGDTEYKNMQKEGTSKEITPTTSKDSESSLMEVRSDSGQNSRTSTSDSSQREQDISSRQAESKDSVPPSMSFHLESGNEFSCASDSIVKVDSISDKKNFGATVSRESSIEQLDETTENEGKSQQCPVTSGNNEKALQQTDSLNSSIPAESTKTDSEAVQVSSTSADNLMECSENQSSEKEGEQQTSAENKTAKVSHTSGDNERKDGERASGAKHASDIAEDDSVEPARKRGRMSSADQDELSDNGYKACGHIQSLPPASHDMEDSMGFEIPIPEHSTGTSRIEDIGLNEAEHESKGSTDSTSSDNADQSLVESSSVAQQVHASSSLSSSETLPTVDTVGPLESGSNAGDVCEAQVQSTTSIENVSMGPGGDSEAESDSINTPNEEALNTADKKGAEEPMDTD